MSYYGMIRRAGGGDAAAAVYRADVASGAVANVDTAVSAGTVFVDDEGRIGMWAGDLVDPFMSDRALQDDVGAVR